MTLSHRRIVVLALFVLLVTACASSPQGKAYQTIATCNLTVENAVRAFNILYQTHKLEDPALWGDRRDKAKAAVESYEQIRNSAVDAAKAHGETTLILATINEAANQVLVLLSSYGVK